MRQPSSGPDPEEDWRQYWTIDAGTVRLQPVTRRIAREVLEGGPVTQHFERGSLHDRIGQAMSFAMRDIDSGVADVLPTVWLVARADGRIIGDMGTHGPPDADGCIEIGYSLAPAARGKGVGTAAVGALVGRLASVPGVRVVTAITGTGNVASRRLLERQGFRCTGPLPDRDEVRYALEVR